MIRSSGMLLELERRQAREHPLPYHRALQIVEALWSEARALDRGFPGTWEDDIELDMAPLAMVRF